MRKLKVGAYLKSKIVLVPSFSQLDYYKSLYLEKGECLLGTTFTTLTLWIDELWALHGDGRSKISALQLQLACYRLLQKQDGLFGSCEIPVSLGSAQGLARFYRKVIGLPSFQDAIDEPPHTLSTQEARVLELARLLEEELERRELCLPGHQFAVLSCLGKVDIVFEGTHSFTPVESWFLQQLDSSLPTQESSCLSAMPSRKMAAFLHASGPEAKPRLIADYVTRCVDGGHRKILALTNDGGALFDALLPFTDEMRVSLSLRCPEKLASSKIAVVLQAVIDVLKGNPSSAVVSTLIRSPYSDLSHEQSCNADILFRSDRGNAWHSEQFLTEHVPNFPLLRTIAKQGFDSDSAQTLSSLARGIFSDDALMLQIELQAIRGLLDACEATRSFGGDSSLALSFAREMTLLNEGEYLNPEGIAELVVVPYAQVLDYAPASFDSVIMAESDNINFSSCFAHTAFDLLAAKLGIDCEDASVNTQRALIKHAISCASCSFASCYCSRSSTGDDCYPSFFLDELATHYQEGKAISLGELSIGDESGALVMSNDESRLLHNMIEELDDSKFALMPPESSLSQSSSACLEKHKIWPSEESVLKKPNVNFSVSASSIECYLSCPRKWFLQRCIKADSIDEDLGNKEQGSFVHTVLKRFFEELNEPKKKSIANEPEEAKNLLSQIFDEELEVQKNLSGSRYLPIASHELAKAERLKNTLLSNIEVQAELLDSYEPRYFEFRISPEEKLEYGGVAFQGSVDRIDVDEAGGRYAVIDYKGGIKNHEAGFDPEKLKTNDSLADLVSIELPQKVQALIYAQALRPHFESYGLKPSAALYVSYRSNDPKNLAKGSYSATLNVSAPSSSAVSCDFSLYLDLIERSLTPYIESMKAGQISANPSGTPCQYCPDISCPKKVG